MKSNNYLYLYQYIESLPVISSHEHHFPDEFHKGLTLERLLENSYISTIASSTGKASLASRDYFKGSRGQKKGYSIPIEDPGGRQEFLEHCRYNSYFVWLEKSLQKIYNFSEPITPQNWDLVSCSIAQKHSNDQVHLEILKKVAGYQRVVLDPFWEYGSDLGHPDFFSPTMRTDMFVTSFHPDAPDHDGNSPFHFYPEAPTDKFDDYLDFVENIFTRWRRAGAVAMKSASAYDRSLQYDQSDREAARQVFYRPPVDVSPAERTAYENFMFHWFCQLCEKFEVPFQIHTGLGKLSGSRPMLLEPVIQWYPEIHFVLFHAGYPGYNEIAGLLHNHSNISVDMVWVPITSTSGAVQALHEYIEVAQSSTSIEWGGDAFTSEEAFGALLAWRHVVARVLSEKVDDGYMSLADAENMARKLMYENVARRYGFDV